MGNKNSKKKDTNKINKKQQGFEIYSEITELLLKMNGDLKPKLPPDDEFEEIKRTEINLQRLHTHLDEMKDNEAFTKYNTYQMVSHKLPTYVISKRNIKEKDNSSFYYDAPSYHDVYGKSSSNQEIKQILLPFIESEDISEIILQYIGDSDLLFTVKYKQSGGGTLTDTTVTMDGVLRISSCYSEKSGQSSSVKILNKTYDKQLYMYIVWIIHELSIPDYRNFEDRPVFGFLDFSYHNFIKYEIYEEQRPPPKETICIVGDCEVLMQGGLKKKAKHIRAGDRVQTSKGALVRVECSITQIVHDVINICQIGDSNCYITPEHPCRNVGDSQWKIPCFTEKVFPMYVSQVNNFILERGHNVIVDNVECITLAHGLNENNAKHEIWGTDVIADFLKQFPSYPDVITYHTINESMIRESL